MIDPLNKALRPFPSESDDAEKHPEMKRERAQLAQFLTMIDKGYNIA